MKLAAIIVAFFPEIDELKTNIEACVDEVDYLIIWKNSPLNIEFLDIERYGNKIVSLGDGENVGIAAALSMGAKWAISRDCSHFLTLDQDSYFENGHLKHFKDLISGFHRKDVGVFGSNPYNGGFLHDKSEQYIEVSDTITSGTVYPLNILSKHGFFEDSLFIDAVDYEYCYRLKTMGLVTIVFPKIILQHKVGYVTKTWLGFKTDNYSAFRTYFIVRNQIIIWKRYPNLFPAKYKVVLIKTHILGRLVKVLLGEKNKIRKVRSIIRGVFHGLSGKILLDK